MADFTLAERARIRRLLGWEARFLQYDTRLESAMDAINNVSPADQDVIRDIFTKLDGLDTKIESAQVKFGVDRVGSIYLNSLNMLGLLKSEAKRYVDNMAAILGVECRANFYGSGGPRHGVRQYA